MIRYALTCREGHGFEAWFRDSATFDAQRAAGLVACAVCGGADVEKALMAPGVSRPAEKRAADQPAATALSAPPEAPAARALAELRRRLEADADYVGRRFAAEARRLHAEGAPESRPIWGEATPQEARALLAEGVPVAPLPPLPRRND